MRRGFAPVELIVAGTASRALDVSGLAFRPILLGYVEDEVAFYESVDVAVVPAFAGTGFKVKVAELVDLDMPLLCAEHAAEGVSLPPPQLFADANAMAQAMVHIATFRPPLADMRAHSGAAIAQLRADFDAARGAIATFLRQAAVVNLFLFEERPLTGAAVTQFVARVLQARALASQERSLLVVPGDWRLDLDELNAVTAVGTELAPSSEREAILQRLDGARLTVWATPRLLAAAEREGGWLHGVAATSVADCRFMDFDLLDDRDLDEIGAQRGAMINHRQGEAPQSLPFRFDQELFCTPLLAGEAAWDPVVTATLRHYLRLSRPQKANAVFVCAGRNAKLAMRMILEMRGFAEAAVFDVGDPEDLEAAAATVLWGFTKAGRASPMSAPPGAPLGCGRSSITGRSCMHG